MRIIQRQTLGLNMQRETYAFFTFWITEFREVFKLIIFSRNLFCTQNVGYHLSPSQQEHLFVNMWVLVMKFTRRVSKNFSHITIDHRFVFFHLFKTLSGIFTGEYQGDVLYWRSQCWLLEAHLWEADWSCLLCVVERIPQLPQNPCCQVYRFWMWSSCHHCVDNFFHPGSWFLFSFISVIISDWY